MVIAEMDPLEERGDPRPTPSRLTEPWSTARPFGPSVRGLQIARMGQGRRFLVDGMSYTAVILYHLIG